MRVNQKRIDELFLKQEFEKKFKEQFRNGLLQGTVAFSKVVRDKATDETKPVEDRLDDIIEFCDVALKNFPQPQTENVANKEEVEVIEV